MSDYKPLDSTADVLPVGLQPTPFGDVWQALQQVAAQVWDVDPSVYRAGIAWMWYALRNPAALDADGLRPLLVAALISEQAPLVKDTQTAAELAEYLRLWRDYTPTYPKLEALYSVFAARVEVRPISDAESQDVVPVADRRLAFYLRVEDFDAERPLTLDEVYQIAVRATPLGSRPVPYFALVGSSDVFAGPASAGLVRALWASEPAAAPPMSFVVVDSTTGAIVHGFNQELTTYELPSVVLNSEDNYETYELPSVSLPTPKVVIGVPITGPVQAFWFTDNGRAETTNKTLALGNRLYLDSGEGASSSTYSRYLGANPVAFTKVDGNMVPPDSDPSRTYIRNLNNFLNLIVSGTSPIRDIPSWSVQVAKLFVLSYVNEQLPDVQIELPINEVGEYGTSITLPTIDGEYESGGKTWKPSAWDIGAFGSSYSLTADTVAHLVFTEVVQYEEITLYMVNENKHTQLNVTSGFTGNVVSSYCYQLYTDAECTTPWTGYDYSNEYVVGNYNEGGVWEPDAIQSVADMPDAATSSGFKNAFILMDTGTVWFASSSSVDYGYYLTKSSIVVRIYPKNQQYYAFYLSTSSVYNNSSVSNGSIGGLKGKPGISSAQTVPWDVQDATLPTRTIQKLLGSAGNEINQSGIDWRDPSLGYKFYQIANASGASISLRTVVFTLSKPTFYGWLNPDKTDKSHGTNEVSLIYDASGNAVQYDAAFTYRVIGIFKSNGDTSSNSWSSVSGEILEQESGTNNLQIRRNYSGTITVSKVWYLKEVINPIETTFGAAVTIPAGYHVESVKCSRGYAFASSVTKSGTVVDYELPGEKVYFDDTNISLIGVKVKPALQITAINTLSQTVVATLSSKSGDTGVGPETASASYVNSGGFFVKGTAKYSDSLKSSNVANAMQQFPVYFNLADSSGNWLYFCFNVPQTLWQFQNGAFSWLGDTTDASDLAYWYNGRAVQIILAKDE